MIEKVLLHFDGLCEPVNPGGVAVSSWMAFDADQNPEVLDGKFSRVLSKAAAIENWGPILIGGRVVADGPKATNNLAEWCGLGGGLAGLRECDPFKVLLIRGDSQLVIRQLTGEWAVRAEHLKPLKARCLEILAELGCEWHAEWVPRAKNEVADDHGRAIYAEYQHRKAMA